MNQKSSFREVPHLVSEAMTPNNHEPLMNITTKAVGGVTRVTTSPDHTPDKFGRNAATFTSSFDIVAAMKDPRYSRDPSYRREVELKIARSGVAEVSDAASGHGQFQVAPAERLQQNAEERAQSIGTGAHEAAMIARAAKAGL